MVLVVLLVVLPAALLVALLVVLEVAGEVRGCLVPQTDWKVRLKVLGDRTERVDEVSSSDHSKKWPGRNDMLGCQYGVLRRFGQAAERSAEPQVRSCMA